MKANEVAADQQISKFIGIGSQSQAAYPFKNGIMKRLQNGRSIILLSSHTSNGVCPNWRS